MKKYLWILAALILIATPLFVLGQADTRKVSTDSQDYSCYRATVVGSSTCFTPSVNATIGGTVPVTLTPSGTQFVSVTAGTVAVSNIAAGTIAVSNLAGGTVAVSKVGPLTGTSFVSDTEAENSLSSISADASTLDTSVDNIEADAASIEGDVGSALAALETLDNIVSGNGVNVTGGTVAVSNLAGGTVAVSNINFGTSFTNVIPIAIVTQGVGNKSVSTSGTSLRLASQAARMVVIKANAANTNSVYIVPGGTTSADYSSTANPGGIELAAKESVTIPLITNVQEVVIDATTSGEGVNYTWIGY